MMKVLLWLWMVSVPVHALELFVGTKPSKPGQGASLGVFVKEAKGVGDLAFEVSYDPEHLTLLGAHPGPLITEQLGGRALFATNPEEFPSRSGSFRFDMVVARGFDGDGQVVSFFFEISDSAKGIVEVGIVEASAADTSLKDLDVEVQGGGFVLPTGVELEGKVPDAPALLPNFPNPFNEGTWIPFQVRGTCDVELRIYDVLGQVVRRIELGKVRAGYYIGVGRALYWDGRDEGGRRVGSGVYVLQLKAGNFVRARKALLLK